jgi:flagellar biosynthesis chaperone FliJ
MQYIELKKLINNEIRQIKERIEKQVKKEDIDNLLSKYQSNNLHELIEIFICQTSRNCINLNYKDFIEELNNELYELSFDNQLLKKQLNDALLKNQSIEIRKGDLLKVKNKTDVENLVEELIKTRKRIDEDLRFIQDIENLIHSIKNKDTKEYPIPKFKGIDIK